MYTFPRNNGSVFTNSLIQCLQRLYRIQSGSDGKASACNAGDPGSILDGEDPLEKQMATHSSILAWRIPWTEEPGRKQSMGSQRVRHDFTFTY